MSILLRNSSSRVLAVAAVAFAAALAPAPANAGCPPSPRPLCRDLAQTKLAIDAAGKFDWRATLGPATSLADFGDPAAATGYQLCAWDDRGVLVATGIPAAATCEGASCWRARGKAGLRYADAAGANGDVHALDLGGSASSRTKIRALVQVTGGINLPAQGRVTVQLARSDSAVCFESAVPASAFTTNDTPAAKAKSKLDPAAPVPPLPSGGCAATTLAYPAGTSTVDQIDHDGLTRTYRVHVPTSYRAGTPMPVVFLLHGGFGSGAQVETSSRMLEVSEAQGFVLVSPDGSAGAGGVRTWNGGACCGAAATDDVDDVGFLAAILDRLEVATCVDSRRVYATGMSNGAILTHRLACDLADRIRAVASVAGSDMTLSCKPARPVPLLEIHGSDDLHIPFDGGFGCGPADASFRSTPATVAASAARNGCPGTIAATQVLGDATCSSYAKCATGADVELCVVAAGGHQWPGGVPSGFALPACPSGYQSQSFSAPSVLWNFFKAHPAS